MIIRKCDYCGKEINVFIKVQTTIGATEGYEYVNVDNMLPLQRKFELCKDCAEKMLNYILGKKEKVSDNEKQ
jgi:hypothetical protein